MTNQTGEHLTTSRISRLLRPLRAKCQKLASFSAEDAPQPSSSAVTITYGSGSRQASVSAPARADSPPLAVLPPPEKLLTLAKLDRSVRESLELSRRIYDVRDAFRNVLQATLSPSSNSRRSSVRNVRAVPEGRIRSLAVLCAMTVGQHIEDQIAINVEEREEDEDETEDDGELKVVDSLYEAVQPQYRKHAIIAHSLSIILTLCPLHHSLLAILLDVTVSYNLASESRQVLRHLFECAFQSIPSDGIGDSKIPQIAHPTHSNYLTQLLDTCRRIGKHFSDRTFVQVFCDALLQASSIPTARIWTCKATINLARTLRSRDYVSFLSLCSAAGQCLASLSQADSRRSGIPMEVRNSDSLDEVACRLGKWLSHGCQRLHDLSSHPRDANGEEEIASLAEILVHASSYELARFPWSADAQVLPESLACLSTMLLAAPMTSLLTTTARLSVHSILRRLQGRLETYGILVDVALSHLSKNDGDCSAAPALLASSCIQSLSKWTRSLRDHSYHLLEASLWSSALSHIESLTPEMGSHYDPAVHHHAFLSGLERLRYEIVRRVEDAERRCFDENAKLGTSDSQTPRKDKLSKDQWRWEDLVGCWVQKTPMVASPAAGTKRRRSALDDAPPAAKPKYGRQTMEALSDRTARRDVALEKRRPPTRAGSVASSSTSAPAGRSRHAGPSAVQRSRSPARPPSSASASASASSSRLSTPHDNQENACPSRSSTAAPAASRRKSNFASILRDAQVNRVVLHAASSDDEGAWLRDSCSAASRPLPLAHPDEQDDEDETDLGTAHGVYSADHVSSDDALDLLAYASSEW